ncbi:MAG: hypothetical protein ACLUB2_05100 [Butyricicoccus pullicaecorum]
MTIWSILSLPVSLCAALAAGGVCQLGCALVAGVGDNARHRHPARPLRS